MKSTRKIVTVILGLICMALLAHYMYNFDAEVYLFSAPTVRSRELHAAMAVNLRCFTVLLGALCVKINFCETFIFHGSRIFTKPWLRFNKSPQTLISRYTVEI